jgi:signal transduction histidine kinase
MPTAESELVFVRNSRLQALATAARPAWLWAEDGSRILWANAAGAALAGASTVTACRQRRFDTKDQLAAEIVRLAATLPGPDRQRLERLRGLAAGPGRPLTCVCSRLGLPDGTPGILVAAAEPVGPAMALGERLRRLLDGCEGGIAAFAMDGRLLYASAAAQARLAGATTLLELEAGTLAAPALESGRASGTIAWRGEQIDVTAEHVGEGDSRALVMLFAQQPGAEAEPGAQSTIAVHDDAVRWRDPSQPEVAAIPMPERRHPLRFVWQIEDDGRFTVASDEFGQLAGPRTMALLGRPWTEVAEALKLDENRQLERALGTRETFSGITVAWPLDGMDDGLPVELSGLPVFDRDRNFRGYRGFGVCRDMARLNAVAPRRRQHPIDATLTLEDGQERATEVEPVSPSVLPAPAEAGPGALAHEPANEPANEPATSDHEPPAVALPAPNVVPFRPSPLQPSEPRTPSLSPIERRAFRELAQELTARLRSPQQATAAAAEGDAEFVVAERLEPAMAELATAPQPDLERVLVERIPLAVLIYRNDALLYANRRFLDLTGYLSLDALAAAGGLSQMLVEPAAMTLAEGADGRTLSIAKQGGDRLQVHGRLFTVPWDAGAALALVLTGGGTEENERKIATLLAAAEEEIRILRASRGAGSDDHLRSVKDEAERAAAARADFLAKISRQLRPPLNAITGFAELIMAERVGPVGNDRYRDYLKDIHAAGTYLVSLVNDLLDLSRIESGRLELSFATINLNELTQQCIGIMQSQANRARIIIRSAFTPTAPLIVADERSLRQIVVNLLGNAIKSTGPGGQIIVSTVLSDAHEVMLRVRDTGTGMGEKELAAALDPFGEEMTSDSWAVGGTGLGLRLTKALAEANRANFSIKTAPDAGTLVEIAFPQSRGGG